ncbi:hypothetical protein GKR50_08735 [Providencia rustigianii]|uniref:hypothetical protein n=1 Tax=Providencia rustigianii TaxID=158850 RepID=UPI000F6D0678|nr:hypothetical protein [Providencia rustigianii]MTC60102.1 hypothetical protein [Providencia rustigianii]VEH56254.1 Uncharacterised protein [Providencia rustigianii]
MFLKLALENKLRLIYMIASFLLIWISIINIDMIIRSNDNFILFSYYASIATIIALLITIMEIIHNINISKSIKEKSLFSLNKFKGSTGLSLSHECIFYYNQSLDNLSSKNYALLVTNFTIAFKLHLNIANNFMTLIDKKTFDNEIENLNELEKKINSTRNITSKSPLGNLQFQDILESLLYAKQLIESKYTYRKIEE